MSAYLRLTITDTLGVWIDSTPARSQPAVSPLAKVTRTFWYRLPAGWLRGGVLAPDRLDRLIDALYGPGWRQGNPDGSRYVILDIQQTVLSAGEVAGRPWLGDRAAFFVVTDEGALREVIPAQM